MNGYSKIKVVSSTDFPHINEDTNNQEATKQGKITTTTTTTTTHDEPKSEPKQEVVGMKLSRNRSVSAFRNDSTSLQTTMKRAFSVRRSSSVTERYSRIYDQCATVASSRTDDEEDAPQGRDNNAMQQQKKKKKHGNGRILKACKRLFGLQ